MSPLASIPFPIGPDGPAILSLALPPSASRLDDLLCEPFSLAALCLAARTPDPQRLWADGTAEHLLAAQPSPAAPGPNLEALRLSVGEYAAEVSRLGDGSPRLRLVATLAALAWGWPDEPALGWRFWPIAPAIRLAIDAIDLPLADAVAAGADSALFPLLQAPLITRRPFLPSLPASVAREASRVSAESGPPSRPVRPRVEPADCPYLADFVVRRLVEHCRVEQETVQKLRLANYSRDQSLQEAKLEALAEFAAGASHEINNPLAVIVGQTHLLRNRVGANELPHLESIARQARRVHEILREVMAFADPPKASGRPFDFDGLVRDCWDTVPVERGVVLTLDPIGPTFTLDPVLTRQALAAVLRNAVEASPDLGVVRVSAEGDRVVVEDDGPGFDEATARHLFDPFYSGRSAGRGRGLGLSAAWAAMRRQGGTVVAERVGGRTRFSLQFRAGSLPARSAVRAA